MTTSEVKIDIPFEWADELTLKDSRPTKNGQPKMVFATTRATIYYESSKIPTDPDVEKWSWKFKEDETEMDSGYKGHFWNEPYEYKSQSWYREEGFKEDGQREAVVDVQLVVEKKSAGTGWFYNIATMTLAVEDDTQTPELEATEPQISVSADVSAPDIPKPVKGQAKPKNLTTDQRISRGMAFNNATHLIVACIQNPENAKKVLGQYATEIPELINDWDFSYSLAMAGDSPERSPMDAFKIEFWAEKE